MLAQQHLGLACASHYCPTALAYSRGSLDGIMTFERKRDPLS